MVIIPWVTILWGFLQNKKESENSLKCGNNAPLTLPLNDEAFISIANLKSKCSNNQVWASLKNVPTIVFNK